MGAHAPGRRSAGLARTGRFRVPDLAHHPTKESFRMSTAASSVSVPTADGPMPAHLWLPESGTGPGLLLLQEIFGVSEYIKYRAPDLADLANVVRTPQL